MARCDYQDPVAAAERPPRHAAPERNSLPDPDTKQR
jgi:hypothetical protein